MDHDYGAAFREEDFASCRPFGSSPPLVVKLEDPWHEEEEEVVTTTKMALEPHPDENQVISFLDSLLANKKSQEAAATTTTELYVKKEVGSVAGGSVRGEEEAASSSSSPQNDVCVLAPQSSNPGTVVGRFVDGEFSQSFEQTDLRINEVVGLELSVESDPGVKQFHGTVNVYLVHSHELFLRDVIDAKGHQGVKDDTAAMKDHPLRAWVANGNGTGQYNVLKTKMHGDVRGVTLHLKGDNKINLLFTVLSTDQRNFGRNHKAKLWSLDVSGSLNGIPVKVSLPVQVVACLRNPRKLKRSKRRLDGGHRAAEAKQFREDDASASAEPGDVLVEEILRLQGEYLEKLPRPILLHELSRARALANTKVVSSDESSCFGGTHL